MKVEGKKPAQQKREPQMGGSRKTAPPDIKNPGVDNWLDTLIGLATRFRRFAWDIGGVLILAFSLMTLIALPVELGLTGGGKWLWAWGAFLRVWLGFGSLFVVLSGAALGLLMLLKKEGRFPRVSWGRVFALETAAFSALVLSSLTGGVSLERAEQGLDGGRIGWGLAELLRMAIESIGLSSLFWAYLVVAPIFLISVLIGFDLGKPVLAWISKFDQTSTPRLPHNVDGEPAVMMSPLAEGEEASLQVDPKKKKRLPLPPEFRKSFRTEAKEEASTPPPRDERLPPLNMLVNEQSTRPDERNINLTAGLIEKTLAEFGIPAKVVGFRVGPTVTQFAVEPGFVEKSASEGDQARHKVRVAQISGLQRDLALALSAERLRIEAPVPGRPYVGIEVPNLRSSVVRLRPLLESEGFYKVNSPLAIGLGRDVSGHPVVADLTKMPHLLIAGTTGSGKSVCIAAITTCMAMNNTPDDLRLVMIDPKMVELIRFNGLPHLYGKVETNLERILGVLRWTTAEMDRRYRLLESMNARHLDSYNRKVRRRKGGEELPRIVVMIDELADLMMSAPEQTEPMLVRLAQLARATGIHLIVATQRPSTDVVTGLIKANFPARASFAVASSIDSRVILDTGGAESLLGHGDMLFLPPEAPAPIRSQGVMVTDQEVERVITYWQHTHPLEKAEPAPWEKMLEEEEILADRDDLVNKAITIVKETRRASASLLQRRLRIGYPRAARLIDELEDMGIVGPTSRGGREREVLIDPDGAEDEGD
jgi:DNA segregation ATPase FtsK/SpoIIIE, S-DNA-T family